MVNESRRLVQERFPVCRHSSCGSRCGLTVRTLPLMFSDHPAAGCFRLEPTCMWMGLIFAY